MTNALKEKIDSLSTNQILRVWEWTTEAKNEQVPTIREYLMNELERRNPSGFNAWLEQDAPKDMDLRLYMCVNPVCLNCKHWQFECTGTNEWVYTGCVRKEPTQ